MQYTILLVKFGDGEREGERGKGREGEKAKERKYKRLAIAPNTQTYLYILQKKIFNKGDRLGSGHGLW